MLKQPKALILDDSTSAVDTATDARIRKALQTVIPGTTKIIIAQRISSLNRNFTQPVTQQFNSIIMALAGAERIFKLLDEQPETDNSYVALVNVEEQPDGTLTETSQRTGLWAWRHPHQADGTDEACIAAAKLANADSLIRRLPDGYQTVLTGDGANLSQGQRQLIEEKGRYYQLYTGNAIA